MSSAGEDMFDKAALLRIPLSLRCRGLRGLLQEVLGKTTTFGDDELKTLLMMVLRNATTDSPWPLSNNPNAHYNDPTRATTT